MISEDDKEWMRELCSKDEAWASQFARDLLGKIRDEFYEDRKDSDENVDVSEAGMFQKVVAIAIIGIFVGEFLYEDDPKWETKQRLLDEEIFPMITAAAEGAFQRQLKIMKEGDIKDAIMAHRRRGYGQ